MTGRRRMDATTQMGRHRVNGPPPEPRRMSPLAQQHPNSSGPDARMWAEAAALSVGVVKEMADEFGERARDLGAAAEQAEQSVAELRAQLIVEERE
jgi:hypothetical protein